MSRGSIYYIGYGIYLCRKRDVNKLAELKARNISHVLTLGEENVPVSKDTNSINYHFFDIEDEADAPWDTFLKDEPTIKFIESFREKQTNRLAVHCTAGEVRSPFAIRCILIKFFNFTPFQARARLISIHPDYSAYPSMLKAEVGLCSRADKENDFGLREYPLTKSTAPDDKKQKEFEHRSLFFTWEDPYSKLVQKELDGHDVSFTEDQKKQLSKAADEYKWLLVNTYFKEADKNLLPFMDFNGCIPDKVPVTECVLNTVCGEVQFFPKT